MVYVRNILAGLAAIPCGVLGPSFAIAFRGINNSKATGLAALVGSILECFLTPWCWVLALSFFALFYFFARLNSKPLRILLFWIPVTAISTVGIGILSLFTYLWIRFARA